MSGSGSPGDRGEFRAGHRGGGRSGPALRAPIRSISRHSPTPGGRQPAAGGRAVERKPPAGHRRRRRRHPFRGAGRSEAVGRKALHPGGDLSECQGDPPGKPLLVHRGGGFLFPRLRQPAGGRGRSGLFHRQPHRGPSHQRLAHPAQGDPRPSTGHRARGTGPQLSQPLQPVGRRQGRPAGVECRAGLPSAGLRMALAGGAGSERIGGRRWPP